ncbi:MAG: hypothetical protein ABSF09_08660 [Candidatus Bathyarchaeia archaeon]
MAIVLWVWLPWYPVISSQTTAQSFTYSPLRTSSRSLTLYNLPAAVTLQGLPTSSSSAASSNFFQDLGDISLQPGWVMHLQVSQCQSCYTTISQDFGINATVFDVGGPAKGDFLVVMSGRYKIMIENLGPSEGQVTSIIITADMIQSGDDTRTNMITYTKDDISKMAPITLFATGHVADYATLVILIAIIVVALAVSLYSSVRNLKLVRHINGEEH